MQIFNNRYGVAETIPMAHALEIDEDAPAINWDAAQKIVFQPELLGGDVLPEASYLSLHSDIRKAATYDQLDKQVRIVRLPRLSAGAVEKQRGQCGLPAGRKRA